MAQRQDEIARGQDGMARGLERQTGMLEQVLRNSGGEPPPSAT
jgi:hypothetical protein